MSRRGQTFLLLGVGPELDDGELLLEHARLALQRKEDLALRDERGEERLEGLREVGRLRVSTSLGRPFSRPPADKAFSAPFPACYFGERKLKKP